MYRYPHSCRLTLQFAKVVRRGFIFAACRQHFSTRAYVSICGPALVTSMTLAWQLWCASGYSWPLVHPVGKCIRLCWESASAVETGERSRNLSWEDVSREARL